MRWALRRAQSVIAVSHELAAMAVALGAPADRVRVIENGVDTVRFFPTERGVARARVGLTDSGGLLVSVGHLVPRKGFHRLILAMPLLLQDFPGLRLAIVGGVAVGTGGYAQELKALVSDLGLEQAVALVGAKPGEEIALWLSAADLFVLATEREGCPNAVWEALACGRPVVVTKVGEVDRIVPPFGGIVFERSNDPEILRRCIFEGLRREWDSATIREYAEKHTWDLVAGRVVQAWRLACQDGDTDPRLLI